MGVAKAICSVEGCEKRVNGLGLCPMHYRRYKTHGTVADLQALDPLDRFWRSVTVDDAEDGCWIWTGSRNASGYGSFTIQRKPFLAHRWLYEVLVGPIAPDLTLDHLCRQPPCVRPGHLDPVTSRTNTLRGISPAAENARKTACKYGHPLSGDNLFVNVRGERQCRTCTRVRELAHRERKKLSLGFGGA